MAARHDRDLRTRANAAVGAEVGGFLPKRGRRTEGIAGLAPHEPSAWPELAMSRDPFHAVEPRTVRFVLAPHHRASSFRQAQQREAGGGHGAVQRDLLVDVLLVV